MRFRFYFRLPFQKWQLLKYAMPINVTELRTSFIQEVPLKRIRNTAGKDYKSKNAAA
jgi:hypothetical protein